MEADGIGELGGMGLDPCEERDPAEDEAREETSSLWIRA